ncbi:MAG: transposase, partial [Acidobacteriota bacterium]|nr:transposase [Acidobacteriota bacterium]
EHQPIDLLPDRTAETLADWLKAHPEIEIFSRDRSSAYVDAARTSPPQAKQVADRWHLLKNLGDLVERYFVKNHCLLTRVAAVVRAEHLAQQAEVDLPAGAKANSLAISDRPVPVRRQTLFNSIKVLQAQGKSLRRIARELKTRAQHCQTLYRL